MEKLKDIGLYTVATVVVSVLLILVIILYKFVVQFGDGWAHLCVGGLMLGLLGRRTYLWYRDVHVFRSRIPADLWSTEHNPEKFTTFYRAKIDGHSVRIEEREVLGELWVRIKRKGSKFVWEVTGSNKWQLMAIMPPIVMVVAPLFDKYKSYRIGPVPVKAMAGEVLKDLRELQAELQTGKKVAPSKSPVTEGSEIAHTETA